MTATARFAILCLALLPFAGCAGTPGASESRAREDLGTVESRYRPGGSKPRLPPLAPDSPLVTWLEYAMLNDPRVEAAWHDWAASVEAITGARSLPDPRLTFAADITSMIGMLMPGLMIDLPGPGKLGAAGEVAAADSRAGYLAFEAQVLRTAFRTKAAYHRLRYLEDSIAVQREALALIGDLEALAKKQVGAGRATIQDVLRARIESETLATRIVNLEDSRGPLIAEFRASLGHAPSETTVPAPSSFEDGPAPPPADTILAIASARNPDLRRLEEDVRRAGAALDLARLGGVPDLSLGLGADVRGSPVVWRLSAGLTLPIWRDKVEAGIAAAQQRERSAESRLTAGQLALAVELAALLYEVRESTRDDALFGTTLGPLARQSLETARSGYASGRSSFLDVIEAERQLLGFELSHIEARTRRELALASLSLLIAGIAPEGAPVLPAPAEEPRP